MNDQDKTNRLSIVLSALRGIKALVEDHEDTEADFSKQRAGRRLAQHSAQDDPEELGGHPAPEPV